MPIIERSILLSYRTRNYEFKTYKPSDATAIRDAIHELEKSLGKMHGGLIKHFKNNPDDIIVEIR